ncbi:MAG TPA: hypothetical protein VN228_14445 [Pyrinomonadaceae bacterium]|nr:hypothetical protein [Pyrinomonadaceae bacterium]
MSATTTTTTTTTTTAPTARAKLFGMFELDAANTVLYSRVEGDGNGSALVPPPDLNGCALFGGVCHFANADELRQRINSFRSNGAQAASFDFTCEYDDGPVPVRVLLARVRERTDRDSTKSVLIHIRRRH